MTDDRRPEDDPRRQRAERLAQALRENLRRRKRQVRARANAADALQPESPSPTDRSEQWTG